MSQTPPSGNTVVDLAIATPTLSTLVTAVKAAGLATTLSGTGPFTVFAPTNAAFAALGAAVPTLLLPANKALLVKVLEYHVVSGTVLSSALTNGVTETTLEGQKINITVMNSMVMVNKASINGTQVMASNGVVHIINKVLLYPGFALSAPGGAQCVVGQNMGALLAMATAVPACADKADSGFASLSCGAAIAHFSAGCADSVIGSTLTAACPKSCGTCGSTKPSDAV